MFYIYHFISKIICSRAVQPVCDKVVFVRPATGLLYFSKYVFTWWLILFKMLRKIFTKHAHPTSLQILLQTLPEIIGKSKAIPVTGREGP
jgi:hypothetical protein